MRVLLTVGVPVVAAGLIVGGMSWGASTVERQYELAWTTIQQEGTFDVVSQQFDRGWRSSTARTELALADPFWDDIIADLADGDFTGRPVFVVEDTIEHGPLFLGGDDRFGAARVNSEITLDEATRDRFPWLAATGSIVSADTLVDFRGNSTVRYTSPGFEETLENGQTVRFSGLSGTTWLNRSFDEQRGELTAGSLELTDPDDGSRISLQGFEMTGESRLLRPGIWLGTGDLALREFAISIADEALEAEGFTAAWVVDEDEGLLMSDMTAGLERFRLVEGGAEDIFRDMRLHFTAANIDADVVEQFMEWSQRLNQGQMSESEFTMRSMSALPDMLAADPHISIEEFSLETPEGRFSGGLSAQWTGGAPDMNNPFGVFDGLAAELRLSGPEKWWAAALGGVDQAAPEADASEAVRAFLEQGLVVRDNGDLSTEITLRDGMVQANGRPLGSVWQLILGM